MADPINTVPQPTFGPAGFVAPSEKDAILPAVKSDIDTIFGGGLDTDDTTPQGQLATSMAAAVGNKNDLFVKFTNQVDPAYADGRMQDGIARIYFIERMGALPTVVTCTLTGLSGLVVPSGSLAADVVGNLYSSNADATIGLGGTVDVDFSAIIPGAIPCPAGTLTRIYRAVNGWDTITNQADGALGRGTETRAEFEDRRRLSVAQNANGSLAAILGAVLNVAGVLDVYVTENVTDSPLSIGGITLGPHSLYVAAVGGMDADVARAIWSRKAPGCGYNGNTTVTVLDESPYYNPPFPAYAVSFQRPDSTTIIFSVNVNDSAFVPADAATLIQNAIISAFAGEDGGPRMRIASKVFASRFYAAVQTLGAWAELVNMKVGCINNPSAVLVGAISGTTLTVASVSSGAVAIGQTVLGLGVVTGTTIISGSGTSWQVSITQNLTSRTLYGCLANLDDVSMLPTQEPVVAPNDIVVALI